MVRKGRRAARRSGTAPSLPQSASNAVQLVLQPATDANALSYSGATRAERRHGPEVRPVGVRTLESHVAELGLVRRALHDDPAHHRDRTGPGRRQRFPLEGSSRPHAIRGACALAAAPKRRASSGAPASGLTGAKCTAGSSSPSDGQDAALALRRDEHDTH